MKKAKEWEALIKNNLGCGLVLTFTPGRDGYAILKELSRHANVGHVKFVNELLPKALLLNQNWSKVCLDVEVVFSAWSFWCEFSFQKLVQNGLSDVTVAPKKIEK